MKIFRHPVAVNFGIFDMGGIKSRVMNGALPTDLNINRHQRVPMRFFAFGSPLRHAADFRFEFDPQLTNGITYYVPTGEWNMPLKILRSSGQPKPVLMLLHGMGLHSASFRGICGHLLAVCDVIVVDYTAFTSAESWPEGGVSLRVLAHTVMRIADMLGLEKINIGGSSLGGGLSLMAAVDFSQRINHIVLFNPAIFPQILPSFYHLVRVPMLGPLVMRLMAAENLVWGVTTFGYVNPAHVDQELVAMYQQNMRPAANRRRLVDLIRHLPEHDAEVRHYLEHFGRLPQEVLVIWGEQDTLLAAGTDDRLRQCLPHTEFHSFPDLSHLPHEESPDRIGPIVAKFIAGAT